MIPSFLDKMKARPRWMPMSLFLSVAKGRAKRLIREDMERYYPRQMERLEGIAEGAGIDKSWAFLSQSLELMITISPSIVQLPACTSIAVGRDRSVTGETLVAKNFDYPGDLAPFHLTCCSRPTGRNQTLGCTMVNMPATSDGMNEHGLTVTRNLAYSMEEPSCFAPLSCAIQEMLETCGTTGEAVDFLAKAKHGGGGVVTLADSNGEMATVEVSHNHSAVRRQVDGLLLGTNHYLTDEMRKYEIPREAVFNDRVAGGRAGERIHRSSEERFNRAQALLERSRRIDEGFLKKVLSDHGELDRPSNETICQHGEFIRTSRSNVFLPERRAIKVLYGNPCEGDFAEFSFAK